MALSSVRCNDRRALKDGSGQLVARRATAADGEDDRPRRSPVLHHLPRIADRFVLSGLRLRGYRRRWMKTSVGRVHALEADGRGELPPVVILHGLSAAGQYYANLLELLRPHVRRVIAPDMPGHGFSALPRGGLSHRNLGVGLAEALDELLDEPAVFFGNSLGGAAAVRYATDRPENVSAIFLAAPGGAPMSTDELSRFVDGFMLHDHARALDFVDRLFRRPPPLRHLFAWGVRQQMGREGIEELLRSVRPDDLLRADELRALTMPITVLFGDADRILWPSHRAFFENNLPGQAELISRVDYGHVPHMKNAEGLADLVVSLLRRAA